MPTDASFRFSTYLTFALASVVLGYAEYELLPEVAVFAALTVIALGVLYFLESRVAFLTIPAANKLGVVVGLCYMMWAAYRIKREVDTGEFGNMGWHMFFVAMCGPFVMLLIVAKVARGDKHAGDYWTLHAVALAGVGLSAALAEQPICFVLVGLYLTSAVWSLTLLHLGRARGAIPPIPGGRQPATKAVAVSADPTGHRTDLRPALFWAIVAVVVAVPLYLITPRSDAGKADFGKPRIEIGYAADQMVDLNRTGPLTTNPEPAFEFTATNPDGTPKTDVSTDQKWRGKSLRLYGGGEWKPPPVENPHPTVTHASGPWQPGEAQRLAKKQTDDWIPPDLGPGQFTITFDVPARLRSTFTAEPVVWAPDQPPPLAYITNGARHGFMPLPDGSFFWDTGTRIRAPRRYIQTYRVGEDPDVSPPFRFTDPNFELTLVQLRQNTVPRVKEYADGVVNELIRTGELPADCRSPRSLLPKLEHHDTIARKFSAHLATTPTLEYTTELKRVNTKVDPIEDFLFHSKAGHCERYATALVLMLRSQGIPAMFVLGFKGCEHDENGKYLVRQEHAHAWVEALVPKPGVPVDSPSPLARVYQWRILDPTPGAAQSADTSERGWFSQANTWVETRFHEYVTNYTPEQRQKAIAEFASGLVRTRTLVGLALVIAMAFVVRYVRRRLARRANPPAEVAESARWFAELIALLAAHGIIPAPGDTAREFATTAATALRQKPRCEAVADIPLAWADAYYQNRFGGMPPSDARLAELEAGLAALRAALAH